MKSLRSLIALFFFLITSSYSAVAQNNCDSMDYSILLVHPFEFSDVEYGESVEMQVVTSFPPSEIFSIEWFSEYELDCQDCLSNSFTPTDTTTVSVLITLNDFCTVSAEYTFNVFLRKDVFVPNAFSPNNDGINDAFYFYAYKSVERIISFEIFSRKGHLVHKAYDYLPNTIHYGWNGTFKGKKLHSETYVWKAVIEYINGEVETLTGTVDKIP
ncbi:MAG: gliding motility-associated C-terminal domain-containing protein [Saprospiraceae bacterium]